MDFFTFSSTVHLNHHITINNATTEYDLIKKLSEINTECLNTLNLTITPGHFIKAPVYIILIAYINNLRIKNTLININFTGFNCTTHNYASRINVFNLLKIDFTEQFKRHDTSHSMVPITHLEKNTYHPPEQLKKIFQSNFNMNEGDIDQILFLIGETICNTTMHSKSSDGAYMFIQRYPANRTLEFILVDAGIGVKESLSKNPQYTNIPNIEAVQEILKYEVSSGEGRGHGLYFLSEFIKRNNCELTLISNENNVNIKNGMLQVSQNPHWEGVILKIIFKFDTDISIFDIMKEKYS